MPIIKNVHLISVQSWTYLHLQMGPRSWAVSTAFFEVGVSTENKYQRELNYVTE